jgi:UDP-glucose 4-epimerase
MKRVAITGSSGYLGGRLVEYLRGQDEDVRILGVDIQGPRESCLDEFVELDIRSPGLADALRRFQPDTIVHGAFVLQPMRNEREMHEVNVEGSRNLLAAAAAVGPERLMLVSSATAYGAWPDNPVPMEESHPLRACRGFRYAADKTEVEGIVAEFSRQHAEIAVSCVRPAIIGGPKMDNYLSRIIFGMPFLVLIDGRDAPVQLVHEQDVVAAIHAILVAGARGAFNVGPPDWVSVSEIAKETERRALRLPFWLVRLLVGLAWTLRLPRQESPPGILPFVRHPWVVAPTRLERELGYRFQFSCRETMFDIIRHSKEGSFGNRRVNSR